MSAEDMANFIIDRIDGSDGLTLPDYEVTEDARTGGFFFDVRRGGRDYEVLVVETKGGVS